LKTTVTRPRSARGGAAGAAATVALLAALMSSAGCGSTSFVPPPPPESSPARDSGPAARYDVPRDAATSPVPAARKPEGKHQGGAAKIVELILARPADTDREYLAIALRRELGKDRTIFRLTQPESGASFSPEQLADAIRAAVGRGVAGLVVEPREQPAVVDALHEAVGRGVAVLLLDRAVPARGGRSIPRVEFTGFADVGPRIVQDVLEADRSRKRADPGRIILLHHRSEDPYLEPSLASLLGPCKASGKPTEIIAFEGPSEGATAAVRKSLEADPKLDILLADDTSGTLAAYRIIVESAQTGRRAFLLAGYTSYDTRTPEMLERAQAFADRSIDAYAMKSAQAIRNLLDGKPVVEVVEVPVTFHRRSKTFVPTPEKPDAPERKTGKP
jgi:ABC-type sugar transport system substrate-binding protein